MKKERLQELAGIQLDESKTLEQQIEDMFNAIKNDKIALKSFKKFLNKIIKNHTKEVLVSENIQLNEENDVQSYDQLMKLLHITTIKLLRAAEKEDIDFEEVMHDVQVSTQNALRNN